MTKTILITGSTDGIGRYLALTLARDGHEVILHGRNKEKLQETLMSLQQETGSKLLHAYRADFSNIGEVKQFNKAIQRDFKKLDVLINNAGIFSGSERQANKENVELTFMVSVLAPYIIIKDLQPLLERSEAGHIINTSSYMHHFADTTDLDFGFERSYSPKLAYNNSKLYIIWLTRYLAEQFADKKLPITVNAYHPGLIATKMVTGGKPIITKQANASQSSEDKNQPKSVEEGIKTGYYLAISAEVADQSGLYFDDCQVKPVADKSFSQVSLQKLLTYCEDKLSVFKEANHG